MAVKASDQVTIAVGVDVASVETYYKLQSSIANPPSKPTTADPSDWTNTEPTYDGTATNTLYTCQKTTLTDNSFLWGAVSKSSSYEAAKSAWNLANSAYEATQPIESKTFTGIIGSGTNDAAGASLYFAKVHPTDYYSTWVVKLHIEVTSPLTYQQNIDISVSGYTNAFVAFDSFTARSGSAVGLYFINLYCAKQAGITAGKGHALGFGLRASTNPLNTTYARTIRVDVLELINCTLSFIETPVKYADMDGTGSTNYQALTEMSVVTNGQNATNNANSYDRTLHNNALKTASENVTGKSYAIIATSLIGYIDSLSGYQTIVSGSVINITKPLLWGTGNVGKSTTFANSYEVYPSQTVRNNIANWTGTTYNLVYLFGVLNGTQLTVDTNVFTDILPTEEDGKVYIPIGILYSTYQIAFRTSSDLWAFVDGKFRQVDASTIISSHRIYYRTETANSSLTAPTTWVEEATGNVYNQWTTKVPPLAVSTAVGQTKYLYLYTCEQRKRLDGTTLCTKVLLDENTTVINGGSIITNSITANQIAAGAITAEKLNATNINASNSLTIGALSTSTQSSILNSELSADIASAAKRTDVSIAVTAIDYTAGTANLQASLYIDGVLTTSGVTYQWLKDGTNISGQTSRTLSVTSAMGLSHVYSCTATY